MNGRNVTVLALSTAFAVASSPMTGATAGAQESRASCRTGVNVVTVRGMRRRLV